MQWLPEKEETCSEPMRFPLGTTDDDTVLVESVMIRGFFLVIGRGYPEIQVEFIAPYTPGPGETTASGTSPTTSTFLALDTSQPVQYDSSTNALTGTFTLTSTPVINFN